MVRRSRPLALDADSRLSRRRAMQLGLGAAAAYGLTSMPMAPARVGAQETGAADVTGPFDWKRHDGTTIRALVNEHPYTTALKGEPRDLYGTDRHHRSVRQVPGVQLLRKADGRSPVGTADLRRVHARRVLRLAVRSAGLPRGFPALDRERIRHQSRL